MSSENVTQGKGMQPDPEPLHPWKHPRRLPMFHREPTTTPGTLWCPECRMPTAGAINGECPHARCLGAKLVTSDQLPPLKLPPIPEVEL